MPEESAEVFSSGEQPLLFEREDDLAALDAALTEAVAGTGGVLLIEGPAGIGKTVLLEALRRRASAAKMTVLAARGGELERGFGFGIVRQLLEGALIGADAAERDRLLAGAARLAEPVFTDVRRPRTPVTSRSPPCMGCIGWWSTSPNAPRCFSPSTTPSGPTSRRCDSYFTSRTGSPACPSWSR